MRVAASSALGVFVAPLVLAAFGCRKEPPKEQAGPEVLMVESQDADAGGGPAAGYGGSASDGPDRVVISSPAGDLEVTVRDGDALREDLLKRLRAFTSPDRDELIQWTEHAAAEIDPDGAFRLGAWVLGNSFGELALTYRFRQSRQGMALYVAPVVKEGGTWTVKEIRSQIVHRRP